MHGFLNLNKPLGLTSHDCVAKLRRLLQLKRIGHAGTLDPAASGVLPIAIGKATRLLPFLPSDKAYRATIRLGLQTTTDDLMGEVTHSQAVPHLELASIQAAIPHFLGTIQQIPPRYSAVQIQGQRLYHLARAGKDINIPARQVTVYQIEVLAWYPGEFPEIELMITCGAGTYIRAIARDLGAKLGVGGTLAALERTQSSGFNLADSLTFDAIEQYQTPNQIPLVAPATAIAHLPILQLSAETAWRWCQGQKIEGFATATQITEQPLQIQQEDGRFLGIGQVIDHQLRAKVVFAEQTPRPVANTPPATPPHRDT